MTTYLSIFCLSSLLLLNFIGAKPLSELQASLRELLEEEEAAAGNASVFSPEEVEGERTGGTVERRDLSSWSGGEISAKENQLERLLGDILSVSKRSRFKKGGLRSCFGVRLDRIGSASGLGC